MIYTAHTHPFWQVERKKISRKFGRLIRSNETSLDAMLWAHRPEVEKFILQQANIQESSIKGEGESLLPPLKAANFETDGDAVMVAVETRA